MPDSNDILYTNWLVDFLGALKFDTSNISGDGFLAWLSNVWNIYSIIALILSALFFLGFVYARIRLGQLNEIIDEGQRSAEAHWQELYGHGVKAGDARWAEIQKNVLSHNPNDWKAAIIDADIMLEQALTTGGFPGETIGERLQSIPRGSFDSLNDAWEAHKVRNMIAHEAGDFTLTQLIAQQTITQFERALRELGSI